MGAIPYVAPNPGRLAVRAVTPPSRTFSRTEYGALLRSLGHLTLADSRQCSPGCPNSQLGWTIAVLWFELARFVDPEGQP